MSDVNILIAFYSRGGVTEKLALAIAEGATETGAEVRVRRAREFVDEITMAKAQGWLEGAQAMNARYEAPTADDADWADGVAFGTPTRFGAVTAELKAYIDSLGGLWFQGKMAGKAGAAFASTSSPHGGNETTILSLYPPIAHFGMVIVPTGYIDPAVFTTSTPYGASSVSGQTSIPPSDGDLSVAKFQGKRLAEVARALKPLRS